MNFKMNAKDDVEDIYFCSQEPEEETDKRNTKTTLEESSIITDREINDILWQEPNIIKRTIEELPDVIYGNQEQINDITD